MCTLYRIERTRGSLHLVHGVSGTTTVMSENEMKAWADGKAAQYILWITTIFGIPSIILYVIVLIVLIRYRHDNFDNGFFTLFISTGVGDIIQFFVRLLASKIPTLSKTWSEFITTSKLVSTTYTVIACAMFQIQVIGMLFIAMNRLATFLAMMGDKEYWTKRTTVFAVLVQWLWAAAYVSPLVFHDDFYVIELNYNTTYFLHFEFSEKAAQYFWGTGFILDTFINSPALIILYSMATVVLWIKRKNNLSAAQRRELKVERRLAITGAAISALYIAMDVAAVVEGLGLPGGAIAWTVFYVALDLFTYINPLFLVLFCSEVKRHCFLLLGFDSATRVHSLKKNTNTK